MKCILVVVASLILAACATATPVYDAQGNPAHLIQCGNDLAACHAKAKETCPGGYLHISSSDSIIGLPSATGTLIAPQRTITVRCK